MVVILFLYNHTAYEYHLTWYGLELLKGGPHYSSQNTCETHGCGLVRAKSKLF